MPPRPSRPEVRAGGLDSESDTPSPRMAVTVTETESHSEYLGARASECGMSSLAGRLSNFTRISTARDLVILMSSAQSANSLIISKFSLLMSTKIDIFNLLCWYHIVVAFLNVNKQNEKVKYCRLRFRP